MTRRRWIADEVSGNRAALTGTHADHLVRVLRAHVGQEFDIVANGLVRHGRIVSITDGRVDFELAEEISAQPSIATLTLLLAVFKFDRMEWAIEKCTELGVTRVVPVITRRTVSHLAAAAVKRAERWRRIALQASEQSRRATPPDISAPQKLRDALAIPAAVKVVLSESEQQIRLSDAFSGSNASNVLLAVGPEGGWASDELQLFEDAGWISASLGSTVLRSETAAIAATAIALAELNR